MEKVEAAVYAATGAGSAMLLDVILGWELGKRGLNKPIISPFDTNDAIVLAVYGALAAVGFAVKNDPLLVAGAAGAAAEIGQEIGEFIEMKVLTTAVARR